MTASIDHCQLTETISQITSLFVSHVADDDYQQADNAIKQLFNIITQHNIETELAVRLLDAINHTIQTLLTDESLPVEGALVSCVTDSYRVCRNACAVCTKNQAITQDHALLDSTSLLLAAVCEGWRLTEQLAIMLRCAVQFLGNLSSGNPPGQRLVWKKCLSSFLSLLHQCDDEKLQHYTCIVIHNCLTGLLGTSINSPSDLELVQGAACWKLFWAVIKLCVHSEMPYGLYVIETAFQIPGFCDNVYTVLSTQEKLLVVEVLLNQQKTECGVGAADGVTAKVDISNIQMIAESFKAQANMVLRLDAGQHETDHDVALCTVIEIECLCLASSNHESYSPLQEDKDLLSCAVCLLQSIDDVGRHGNSVFSSIEKISREHEIDAAHPVFGLKRNLIRLVGNLVYKHTRNQNLVRELEGIPLILDQTNIDGKNPFITQWAIFAIHNLCENNGENQRCIADLRLEGVANNQAVLEEMGVTAETRGDKVVIKKPKTV